MIARQSEPERLAAALAAVGLPADTVVAAVEGGASRTAYRVELRDGPAVLRLSDSESVTDGRVAAMKAARGGGLPAPEVLSRGVAGRDHVTLLSWIDGASVAASIRAAPHDARKLGRIAGRAQRQLHALAAPPEVLPVDALVRAALSGGPASPTSGGEARLLHLDWHPSNLLVNSEGELAGVIDWDNAAAGSPMLDVARTYSLLSIDPNLAALSPRNRAVLDAFRDGWAEGYGIDLAEVGSEYRAWAGRLMLADLAHRSPSAPYALRGIQAWADGGVIW